MVEPRSLGSARRMQLSEQLASTIFPRERDDGERTFVGGDLRMCIYAFDRVPGCNGTGSEQRVSIYR